MRGVAVGEPENTIELCVRVRYAETDAMEVAHHTSYIIWFEEARSEFFRQMGGDYAELEQQGIALPVAELTCRYIAPARYSDIVVVKTRLKEMRSRSVTVSCEVILQETGERLALGMTKHICIDSEGRTRSIPSAVRALLVQGESGRRRRT